MNKFSDRSGDNHKLAGHPSHQQRLTHRTQPMMTCGLKRSWRLLASKSNFRPVAPSLVKP